jgi:hypothetical protein
VTFSKKQVRSVFEGVYGIDVTRDVSDQLAYPLYRKWGDFEVSLMHSKWFDYRQLTPVQATYLFASHYVDTYRLKYRKHVDHAAAEYVKPLKNQDLFKCPPMTISGLWRARQHADALGMPYQEYVFDAFTRAMDVQRQYLPKPTHLYTDKVIGYVQNKWEERQRSRLYVAESDLYTNENYLGLRAQNDHHEWLFRQAEIRPNRALALADLVYRQRKLPEEKLKVRYEPEFIAEIQSIA